MLEMSPAQDQNYSVRKGNPQQAEMWLNRDYQGHQLWSDHRERNLERRQSVLPEFAASLVKVRNHHQ
jgi:hypothetical protein